MFLNKKIFHQYFVLNPQATRINKLIRAAKFEINFGGNSKRIFANYFTI
jgi:hypothetical protein